VIITAHSINTTASAAILDAMEALGGEASIKEVEDWIASNLTDSWADIRTAMTDLAEPASASTSYRAKPRCLFRLGSGRYRIRDDWQPPSPDAVSVHRPTSRSRKAFIESHGATCRNWTWSWSFVNESQRIVIFGAWDRFSSGNRSLILDEAWATTSAGRRSSAYRQSREHVRLVEEAGYSLLTFPLKYSTKRQDADGQGPARIDGFVPELTRRTLVRVGSSWYASDDDAPSTIPEQVDASASYREGAAVQVLVNGYERNDRARKACIAHFGAVCQICRFDFERFYGPMGRGVIHVHHRTQLADRDGEYDDDPIRDLIPVCPNCHAMIHLTREPLDIEAVQGLVAANGVRNGT
jgi:5-methylcytosine-specific restriction protein A